MDSVPKALVASAVIVAVGLIVAADFLSSRYQITGTRGGVYRLDRFTGAVAACTVNDDDYGAAQEANTGATAHCDLPEKKQPDAGNKMHGSS